MSETSEISPEKPATRPVSGDIQRLAEAGKPVVFWEQSRCAVRVTQVRVERGGLKKGQIVAHFAKTGEYHLVRLNGGNPVPIRPISRELYDTVVHDFWTAPIDRTCG